MNKKTMKLMFSCKSKEWETPQWLFDKLNKEFNFTLDPCATKETAKCKRYFTPKEDGLKQNWGGNICFVNPPYGREISKWVKKSWEESYKDNTLVVMLIPARTDTIYFHKYIWKKAEIRFIKGRLKFNNPNSNIPKEKWNTAPFPSMICIFNGYKTDENKIKLMRLLNKFSNKLRKYNKVI